MDFKKIKPALNFLIFFSLIIFGFLFLTNNSLAYQPPGKPGCPNLSTIPISVDRQSGTDIDTYQVTLKWEQLNSAEFDQYKSTDVYIYVTDKEDPYENLIQAPTFSGEKKDGWDGRTRTNRTHPISGFDVITGSHKLYIHLAIEFSMLCRGYEVMPLVIQITKTACTLPPGQVGLTEGQICSPDQQYDPNKGGNRCLTCPTNFPCEIVRPVTPQIWACGGDQSYCKKNGCPTPITPTPTSTPTTTPTSSPPPGAPGVPCKNGQGIETAIGCVPTEPTEFIRAISRLATGMGGGIALLLIIAGAFRMITSAGNPDAVKAGSEQITSAIIGLLFIIFAVLLLQVIGVEILDLPGFGPP